MLLGHRCAGCFPPGSVALVCGVPIIPIARRPARTGASTGGCVRASTWFKLGVPVRCQLPVAAQSLTYLLEDERHEKGRRSTIHSDHSIASLNKVAGVVVKAVLPEREPTAGFPKLSDSGERMLNGMAGDTV